MPMTLMPNGSRTSSNVGRAVVVVVSVTGSEEVGGDIEEFISNNSRLRKDYKCDLGCAVST